MTAVLLTATEARVLASLVEKSITTPAYYPMTVNGLMAAANQKSSREPVMSLSEGEVGNALLSLEQRGLVARDDSSARATKWRQKFQHQWLLKPATQAVLVTLILRGAQTSAELRANAAALGGPADIDGVQAALDDLADRAQPLVMTLPRQLGQSAVRHAQLLCGEPDPRTLTTADATPRAAGHAGLDARISELEQRLSALEARLSDLGG
ncbi:MAG: DUF480 domain-containing protein [Stagnimonas sp.]|nr:DUF480 domain-containing protein [Stagnimonas sp.]